MKKSYRANLKLLAYQGDLDAQSWFELVEGRADRIRPCLRRIPLRAVGDLMVVEDGLSTPRELKKGGMEFKYALPEGKYYEPCGIPGFEDKLALKGIFADEIPQRSAILILHGDSSVSGRMCSFWGLTREGKWLLVEFTEYYFDQPRSGGKDRRIVKRSKVSGLSVSESTPEQICKACDKSPQHIWEWLGRFPEIIVQRARQNLEEAQDLKAHLDAEDLIVRNEL